MKSQIRQQRQKQEELRRKYESENNAAKKIFLAVFAATAIFALVSLILILATDTVYIHNTAMLERNGREVSVKGAAFLKALFTKTYTSAAKGYGDLAVPFYAYAKAWCPPAAVFTLIALIFSGIALASAGISLAFAAVKKDYKFAVLSLASSTLLLLFTVILYAICLSMSSSQILPVFCSGNPACSIRSDMLFPLLLSLIMFGGNLFALIKFLSLEKIRRQIGG